MFNLSRSDFDRYDNFARGRSAASELARRREREEELTETVMDIVTVGGVATGLGWWSGRYGMPAPLGIPADLILAGVSYGIVAFGPMIGLGSLGRRYNRVLANVGAASLAHYATFKGTKWGRQMRAEAGEAALTEAQETGAAVAGWQFNHANQIAQGSMPASYMPFGAQQHAVR